MTVFAEKSKEDDRMEYDAVDIARRMVQISIDRKIPLTNLKLQKLLYYAWIDYYKEKESYLFRNRIQAWTYGPVVPDAYYDFWKNVSNVIRYTRSPSREIDSQTDEFLWQILQKYRDIPTYNLVDMTNGDNTPWKRCYKSGKKEEIPFQIMKEAPAYSIDFTIHVKYDSTKLHLNRVVPQREVR